MAKKAASGKKPGKKRGKTPSFTAPEVRKARKAELQAWCDAVGLDADGTVPVLRERLLAHLEGEEYLVIEEEAPKPKRKLPKRGPGQIYLYTVEGKALKVLDLPAVFRGEIRTDVIRRAVGAAQANRRQPYGPTPLSGLRHVAHGAGKGRGLSRVPRIAGNRRGALAPGTVGGRRSHPPRPDRVWTKKLNKKERRLAKLSALAATADPRWVTDRGHRFQEALSLPLVVEGKIESLAQTKDAATLLRSLGVYEDVERATSKKVRAGKGTMRARRYRRRRGPLVVLPRDCPGRRAFRNLPGVEVADASGLNAELLAPGGLPGRLTVFSETTFEEVGGWAP